MRGLSVRGARRLTSGGVLGQYGEHGEQAQRSNGGPVMCLGPSAGEKCGLGVCPTERKTTLLATVSCARPTLFVHM